ncbi:MAG: chemotaxis response regulator protein-glutamate methylesterase, partial [Planctomycetota bacterium]|nr:chemotaxis response regulator protein-glutamate methylesterase [Planctomycetota bacterium]
GLALSRGTADGVDVVVLDLFLVDEDWREALKRLRESLPRSRVLALAPDNDDGRAAVAQAVELGASEGVLRPRSDAEFSMSARAFGEKLLGRVRALAGAPPRSAAPRAVAPSAPPAATPAPSALAPKASTTIQPRPTLPPRRGPKPVTRIDVVAIGVSTGGPNALSEVLPCIPKDFPVPVVIVQHMPPGFTLNLAQNLNGKSKIEVREGVDGDLVRPGLALIAPGDFHMQLQRKGTAIAVSMNRGAPENFCRPAVDVLFRSVVDVYGGNALCVVLTGMGQDGMLGATAIGAAGGTVLAQDEATSVVWGMPGAVARAGLADDILPLARIAGEIDRRVRESRGAYARGA